MPRTAACLSALTIALGLGSACRITLEGDYIPPEGGSGPPPKACVDAEAEPSPTMTFLHENTFRRNCSGNSCHDADQPESGLDLKTSPETAYAALVNQPAMEAEGEIMLVAPGEPRKSYLMLRVHQFEPEEMDPPQPPVPEGEETEFYMPQDIAAGLCEGKRNALQRWIENGAPM